MTALVWLTQTLEYLGGSRDEAPTAWPKMSPAILWGVWWGALSMLIYIFCGQSSKFIYIDF